MELNLQLDDDEDDDEVESEVVEDEVEEDEVEEESESELEEDEVEEESDSEVEEDEEQRIPAIIHRVLANGYYELATCAGLLKDKYRVEELGNYSGIFQTHSNAIVSLREAAIYYNNGKKNSKITSNKKKSCHCGTGCDKRCSCFKAGVNFNSHCHSKKGSKACKLVDVF